MLLDARNTEVNLDLEADIAIVGGGVAGITLARKLSKHARVVLIESGGLEPDSATQALYEGEVAGLDYSLTATRLRYLGGTSNHWGGWCGIFDDIDFEPRPWVPYSGWPIRHGDVRPYYDEAAGILNLGGPRFDASKLISSNEPAFQAFDGLLAHRMYRFSGPVARFGEKYRHEVETHENIHALLHANLTDLSLDESGKRINAVTIRTLSGREGTIRAACVVLACGAIENARILLACNRQASTGIGNSRDMVGRFFMEHPHIVFAKFRLHDKDWCRSIEARYPDHDHRFGIGLTLSQAALRDYQCLNFTGHFFDRDCESNEIVPFGAMTEQAPNPDSRITLSDETDALGMPRTRLDWQLSELDWHTLKTSGEILGREFGRLGLGRTMIRPWVLERNTQGNMGGGSHHMGTTRMADSPAKGVVDANCRVFDTENLYIAGSSVYTTSAAINPTFTLTALALRLAEHLSDELRNER